jgi:hypothetical protein
VHAKASFLAEAFTNLRNTRMANIKQAMPCDYLNVVEEGRIEGRMEGWWHVQTARLTDGRMAPTL